MKLWKNFAFVIVLLALIVSCGSYRQAPEDTIKVLAVTSKGDTIQLDVNSGTGPNVSSPVISTPPSQPSFKPPSNTNQNKGRKKDGN